MRKTLVLTFIIVACLSGGAAANTADDWAIGTVTAGPDGAEDVVLLFRADLKQREQRGNPAALLFARNDCQCGEAQFQLLQYPGGGIRISSSRSIGGAQVDTGVKYYSDAQGYVEVVTHVASMQPGEAISYAFAIAEDIEVVQAVLPQPIVVDGSVTATVRRGGGTSLLRVTHPQQEGVAVSAGSAAAGLAEDHKTVPEGLIGAFSATDFCVYCLMSYVAPDGAEAFANTAGSNSSVASLAGLEGASYAFGFSGPSGDWSWHWAGAGVGAYAGLVPHSEAIYAMYAPVGDSWMQFPTAYRSSP